MNPVHTALKSLQDMLDAVRTDVDKKGADYVFTEHESAMFGALVMCGVQDVMNELVHTAHISHEVMLAAIEEAEELVANAGASHDHDPH